MTPEEARDLWQNLRDALSNTEKAIQRIIETKAWEPLGYDSFVQAWKAENNGSFLATELRAPVVLAMFEEGASDDEVRNSLGSGSGVSKGTVGEIRRQDENGVPAGEINVREHSRRETPAYVNLSVSLPKETLRYYHDLARAQNKELTTITRELLASWSESRR